MDLSKITCFAFQEKLLQVGRQIRDPQQCKALLDEARRELPLVDSLLGLLSDLDDIPDQQKRNQIFNRIMRDVHVFITLWRLSASGKRASRAFEVKNPPEGPSSLRLRRFGMN